MKELTALLLVWALTACQAGLPDADPDPVVAELLASQASGYVVPAGAGGMSFTVSASMAAVRWAKLDEAQLSAWWRLWSALQGTEDRPRQIYQDAGGASVNLFDRSPRDGFCVALAQRQAGDLTQPELVAFFDRI